MATVSLEQSFDTKDAADAFAANYANAMWGYDPTIRVCKIDAQWVVMITRSTTCD